MNAFEDYIYHSFAALISGWSSEVASTIYAISFYISAEDDDKRNCTVTLGYNTNEQWHRCTPNNPNDPNNRWPVASTSDEAKWNYAFWLQNCEVVIASHESSDDAGIDLRDAWLRERQLWYSDEEVEADFDSVVEKLEEIERQFTALCIHVAQRLHSDGVISRTFGHAIPILVHKLEYYDEIANQARLANPPGTAKEFEDWIAGMYP